MPRILWSLIVAVVLGVGAAWIWVNRVPAERGAASGGLPPAPAVGHPAPDFTLTTVAGETFTLSALRGRPVILTFWATWCPPCRAELPELAAAHERYAGQVVVVGVNQAEPAAGVTAFAGQVGLAFPLPLDVRGDVSRLYAVRSLPTTFFIDRAGIIRRIQSGPLTEATLAQALKTIFP
ncbi:MAG: redoxin domain-containing protein [Anaerolineae bacterium]|nr:redoxin domain-containing protein [Anaerolineae bacterium]